MSRDLEFAFRMADAADEVTKLAWSPRGVEASMKVDGSPVTNADRAAESAMLELALREHAHDNFLGEEVGKHEGSNQRRWIVDGIDGTHGYAAGERAWGTHIALEVDGEIVLGLSSSPMLKMRWWAVRGEGAFRGDRLDGARRIHVSSNRLMMPRRFAHHPGREQWTPLRAHLLEQIAGGSLTQQRWSHQARVAEGDLDLVVWFAGDIWDHAAPSILVEEAGGRFTDHFGGRRLDTRTAIYSNGFRHDEVLERLAALT